MKNNEKNEGDSVMMMRERRMVCGVEKYTKHYFSSYINEVRVNDSVGVKYINFKI